MWEEMNRISYQRREGGVMNGTLNTRLAETPTIKRKKGMTKSARVTPNQGEWFMEGKAFPASSTKIINCHIR